jgi:hypothetical protein
MNVLRPSSRRLATGSAIASFGMTATLILVARANRGDTFEPPEEAAGRLAFLTLLAMPGVLGLIGAWRGRPMILLCAGMLSLLGAVSSFSGVTLLYLIPAVGWFAAAADRPRTAGRIDRVRLLAAIVTAIPVALLLAFTLGVFGVLLLVLAGGLALYRDPQRQRPPIRASEAALGLIAATLVIACWFAALTLTEAACWSGRATGSGEIEWERIPVTDTLSVEAGEVGETCTSSHPTAAGLTLAATASLAAVTLAAWPRR